jgi:hypothetical protein
MMALVKAREAVHTMAKEAQQVGKEPEESPQGDEHRCKVCGLKLSAYNPGPNCWQHTIGYPWRGPSAKPRYD